MTDRLDKYFVHYLGDYVFLELMPDYVKREHLDFMRNVPLPVKKDVVGKLAEGSNGIDFKHFTMGMIDITGINPGFKYVTQYINFLNFINSDISRAIVMVGIEQAKAGDLDHACITLRAALTIDPEDVDALYNYMLVCRNLYEAGESNEYVADFKLEVFESLITLRQLSPSMPMVYYYLGYAYVNAGQYDDARREWMEFINRCEAGQECFEITQRLKELEEPVRIERGYKMIVAGKYAEGLKVLEEYLDSDRMDDWWPLPYYIGVGYSRTGRHQEAVEMLKKALAGNPSSAEIMAELVIAHNALGDEVNAEKYRKKMDIVKRDSGDYVLSENPIDKED